LYCDLWNVPSWWASPLQAGINPRELDDSLLWFLFNSIPWDYDGN
jgi:hypothetical protein